MEKNILIFLPCISHMWEQLDIIVTHGNKCGSLFLHIIDFASM